MKSFSLLASAIALAASFNAQAAAVSISTSNILGCNSGVTGVIAASAPATSGVLGSGNISCTVTAFTESGPTALTSNLSNDPFGGSVSSGTLTKGGSTVGTGTVVRSHMIQYQPNALMQWVSGSVTFDNEILAVIYDNPGFTDTAYLGAPGTTYNYSLLFGLESLLSDQVSFSGNTVNFRFISALTIGDHLRVITAVPTPASVALLGIGAVGLLASRRRKVA